MFASALKFLVGALSSDIDIVPITSLVAAIALLERNPAYDLILLDYLMPDTSGFTGFDLLRAKFAHIPIAMLSGAQEPIIIRSALAAGAIGWIPKTMGGEPLVHALRLLASGQSFVPPELLIEPPTLSLSPRETGVAGLLSQGMTDKEIADRLAIEPGTVKVHVKNLLKKAGVDNRTKFALMHRDLA